VLLGAAKYHRLPPTLPYPIVDALVRRPTRLPTEETSRTYPPAPKASGRPPRIDRL